MKKEMKMAKRKTMQYKKDKLKEISKVIKKERKKEYARKERDRQQKTFSILLHSKVEQFLFFYF